MSFTVEQVDFLQRNEDVVEARRLFELVIPGETFRLAESNYPVEAGGYTWLPAIQIISAPPINWSRDFQAVPAEYVVAGLSADASDDAVEAFSDMSIAIMDIDNWFGGTVHQSIQLLVDRVAVGPAISLHRGWIRDIRGSADGVSGTFKISVESIFAVRNRTPLGEYTDRDQQRRSPGDRGCEFTPTFAEKTVKGWPF